MAAEISMNWEVSFMVWLQQQLGEQGGSIISFLSLFGEELFLTLVFGTLYWGFHKKAGIHVGVVFLSALVWNPLIKNIFLRVRPYIAHSEIQCLNPVAKGDLYDSAVQGYSFPSNHATAAAACYGSVARYFKSRWVQITAAVLIILVGISRVAAGVHYPTDVLGGYALGVLAVFLVGFMERHIHSRMLFYLVLAFSALPGFFYCRSEDFYSCAGLFYGLLLGILFEERFVKFGDARNAFRIIVRVLLGVVCFVLISEGLKPVFRLIAESGNTVYLLRTLRYMLAVFMAVGVCPMLFRPLHLEEKESEE